MTAVQRLAHFVVDVNNYGIDVNLFVDHSQIVQLERLRAGIWGTDDTWAHAHLPRPLWAAMPCERECRLEG